MQNLNALVFEILLFGKIYLSLQQNSYIYLPSLLPENIYKLLFIMVQDLYVLMITAAVVSIIFKFLKQPVVLGYIVAGSADWNASMLERIRTFNKVRNPLR